MPINKSRLSKNEQERYLRCLQELRAEGCDVKIPSQWVDQNNGLEIVIYTDGSTQVSEGRYGGVIYAVSMRLVARQAEVTLLDCQLETDWDTDIVLESFQSKGPIYKLGRLQYPAAEVLNDRIEESIRFRYPGQIVEGVILFSGLKPIPERYRLGMSAPFRLAFLDQFDVEVEVQSKLFVSRETKRTTGEAEAVPRGVLQSTRKDGWSEQIVR